MTDTPRNVLTDFGDALRRARKEKDLSQEQLALLCGLDRTYISGLERGTRNPTLKVVALVASTLGMTPSQLLQGIELNYE
jgi:transcriptional regulator with XRE-family HTH domain